MVPTIDPMHVAMKTDGQRWKFSSEQSAFGLTVKMYAIDKKVVAPAMTSWLIVLPRFDTSKNLSNRIAIAFV
jgi:hypothetical protein